MDSKEFLDSLVKSGELVTITLNTKDVNGENDQIDAFLIWHDEETIGVKFVCEFKRCSIENGTTTPAKEVKQKIVMYYKTAIQSISNSKWKELEKN